MATVRVYNPETNEPFDVPEHVATRLRLVEGWLSQEYEVVKAEVVKVEEEVVAEVKVVETEVKDAFKKV